MTPIFDQRTWFIALNQSYPLNFLDQLSLFVTWDDASETTTLYTGWQRTYDNLILNVNLLLKSEDSDISDEEGNPSTVSSRTGQGSLQLLVQYNH